MILPKITRSLQLVFLLLLLYSPMTAQQKTIPIPSEALSGVGNVYYISETSDGYLSFSGDLGVSFFDGELSTILLPENGTSFDQPPQSPFFEDDQGSLWFTTYNALYKFNRKTGKIRKFQLAVNEANITEYYRAFHLDQKQNHLFLRAGKNIWIFNIDKETYHIISDHVNSVSLSINPSNNLILGATWTSDTVQIFRLEENGLFKAQSIATGNGQALMVSFINSDSVAYLGTTNGLVELKLTPCDISARLVRETNTITALSISKDSSCVWFSARNQGVGCYSPVKDDVTEYLAISNELKDQEVNAIFQSNTGAKWVAYSNGSIDYMIDSPSNFTTRYKAGDTRITDIVSTEKGEIVIGLQSGEIHISDSSTSPSFVKSPYKGERNSRLFSYKNDIFQLGYKSLNIRKSGLWKKMSRKESMVKELFPGISNRPISLNLTGVEELTILEDTLLARPADEFPIVKNLDFVKILTLSDTSFLLSYQTKELWHYVFNNRQYKIIGKYQFEGPVLSAVQTAEEVIYIGTPTGLFTLKNNKFTPCIPPTSLPSQIISIKSLISDDAGNLWCGTPRGLICYRPKLERYSYFDDIDGLTSANFLNMRSIRPASGEIWMATDSGLVSFSPEKLLNLKQAATPYIAGTWINDLPLENQQILHEQSAISTPFARNSLSFKLAIIAPTRSLFSAIEYQLQDYDLNAISVTPNSTIRYPNLPPGNYTLQLTAINRNGQPSERKNLRITIRPPFTQTIPFYVLSLLFLALIAAAIYIAGLRRERLKQKRLSDQQARLAAERDRIAGEVHDDLGGQISSILYLSEEMLLTGATSDNAYELNRIHELSRTSLQNVRDIIFALDNRRATLTALGEQLRGAGTDFFTDRKIDFACTDNFSRPDFSLTSRQKRNLTLIVKEAWHNTAKHAAATAVTLDITQANGTLNLIFTDNGKGFTCTKSDKATGGYGLENMTEKANAIGAKASLDSVPGKGTTLHITWPLPEQDQ